MSEDVIKINIHGIVPEWDSYAICLDINKPGKKVTKVNLNCAIYYLLNLLWTIVFCIKQELELETYPKPDTEITGMTA